MTDHTDDPAPSVAPVEVDIDIEIAASPQEVDAYVTGPRFTGDAQPVIVEHDPGRRIVFAWPGTPAIPVPGTVEVALTPLDGGGTHVRVIHRGVARARAMRGAVLRPVLALQTARSRIAAGVSFPT